MSVRDTLEGLITDYLLNRRSPPRNLRTQEAQDAEMEQLVGIVVRAAPGLDTDGLELWWEDVEIELSSSVQTRSWPTGKELLEAVSALSRARTGGDTDVAHAAAEAYAIDELVRHLQAYRQDQRLPPRKRRGVVAQAPRLGRDDRTRELIRRGELTNLREARALGFELSEADGLEARSQRMGEAEWRHHVRAMMTFRRFEGMRYEEAEQECAREMSADQLPEFVAHLGLQRPPSFETPAGLGKGYRTMREATARPISDVDEGPGAGVEWDETPAPVRPEISDREREALFQARLAGAYGPDAQRIAHEHLAQSGSPLR